MKVIKYQREDSLEPQTSPRLHTDARAEYLVNMANSYFKKAEHWVEEPGRAVAQDPTTQNLLDKAP